MQWPSTSRGHLCGASGEPKAKPGALLFATMLPSDRPGNPEPFSPPLAKYRSAQKARRLRKGDEGRRAMLHIAGDLNESNKRLANQRKAMLHILADYEEDRRRLSRQTERLDNSRRLTTSLAGLAQGQAAPGGQPQGHDSHHGGPAGNHGRNAAT